MANELGDVVDALPGLVWTAGSVGHVDFVNRRRTECTDVGATFAFAIPHAAEAPRVTRCV